MPVTWVHAIDSFAVSWSDVNSIRATEFTKRSIDCSIWDFILMEQVVEIRCDGVSALCSSKHWYIHTRALVNIPFVHLLHVFYHHFHHYMSTVILAQGGFLDVEHFPAFLKFALEKEAD